MFRASFLCAAVLATSLAFAVKISGTASGFEQKFIRLYSVSDQISRREVKLDVVKINDDGEFQLNGHLTRATLIIIKVVMIVKNIPLPIWLSQL